MEVLANPDRLDVATLLLDFGVEEQAEVVVIADFRVLLHEAENL